MRAAGFDGFDDAVEVFFRAADFGVFTALVAFLALEVFVVLAVFAVAGFVVLVVFVVFVDFAFVVTFFAVFAFFTGALFVAVLAFAGREDTRFAAAADRLVGLRAMVFFVLFVVVDLVFAVFAVVLVAGLPTLLVVFFAAGFVVLVLRLLDAALGVAGGAFRVAAGCALRAREDALALVDRVFVLPVFFVVVFAAILNSVITSRIHPKHAFIPAVWALLQTRHLGWGPDNTPD